MRTHLVNCLLADLLQGLNDVFFYFQDMSAEYVDEEGEEDEVKGNVG